MRRLPIYAVLCAVVSSSTTSSCVSLFPYAPDNLCETRIRALCHFEFQCCNANERSSFGGFFKDEGTCVDEQLRDPSACEAGYAVKESVDEGRFVYDAELAKTCNSQLLDALNSCDAETVFDPNAIDEDKDCKAIAGEGAYGEGTVKERDACFAAYECADKGSICKIDLGDGDPVIRTAVGECVSPRAQGQSCDQPDDFCEPDTFCDGQNCKAVPSTALLNNGDDCFDDSQCKSNFCSSDDDQCHAPPKVKAEICNGNQSDDTQF